MDYRHEVLVVGGGWAGVSAAVSARKAGADVAICEKTDMLLGAGLVGGIFRNNGRFVAAEELIAMGAGETFHLLDDLSRHRMVQFPGHRHASLYDVVKVEPAVRALLTRFGVTVYTGTRIVAGKTADEGKSGGIRLRAVKSEDGRWFVAESFVDATGSSGPMGICRMFGNGCACCVQRCPAFGPRVSLSRILGLPELMSTRRKGSYGAMSGSCKLAKESLNPEVVSELDETGVVVRKLPEHLRNSKKLNMKACQQYALPEYADCLVVLDTGQGKLMSPYFPLDELRSVPGFENARFLDPLGGGKGNSIRLVAASPRDRSLKLAGTDNVFVAGERAGILVGHTEAIVTGTLAGKNALLHARGKPLLEIPTALAIGDFIASSAVTPEGRGLDASYTFAGSVYFRRMIDLGLYDPDPGVIAKRVRDCGMDGVFA
ncbi:MAG: FAD-dependent oxidoreductase [Firmicutes bacterium]|nr:FAD-dependent oxidoreductase [Candidatus Fermentithermobacillaceae bacterium]